jgi:hypothetical protein
MGWRMGRCSKGTRKWDDAVRKLIPGFPDLKSLTHGGVVGISMTADPAVAIQPVPCSDAILADSATRSLLALQTIAAQGEGEDGEPLADVQAIIANPCELSQAQFVLASRQVQGHLSLASSDFNFDADLAGTISITTTSLGGLTSGRVNAFSATLTSNSVTLATLGLDPTSANSLTTTFSGNGTANLTLTVTPAAVEWAAILPSVLNITLAVKRNADGSIAFGGPPVSIDTLVPYQPHLFSDFDGDGVLNYTLDYAAFLQAWTQHDVRCDRDGNGLWNQADLDQWTREFNEDLAHQNP